MMRTAIAGLLALASAGCGITGPSCLARQERGAVATLAGEVGAGQVIGHLVAYDTRGSQNDAEIAWAGQSTPDGPRIRAYVTRAGCTDFTLPPAATGVCAVLATAGAFDGHVAGTAIITNGRGNPDVLGSPAEYRLWIVGDAQQSATYTISITYFYGPDC